LSGHVTLTCLAPPSGTAVVRVNEVATGTSTAAADEFVELANTGTASADISGWKLVYRSATGTTDVSLAIVPPSTTLAVGGFYLLGGASYGGGAQPPDQSFSPGLASPGGAVGLRDGTGTLIDSVGWGTATNALVESAAAPAPPRNSGAGLEHPAAAKRPRHEQQRDGLHGHCEPVAAGLEPLSCVKIRPWASRSSVPMSSPGRSGHTVKASRRDWPQI
jgi:hypothetical protein